VGMPGRVVSPWEINWRAVLGWSLARVWVAVMIVPVSASASFFSWAVVGLSFDGAMGVGSAIAEGAIFLLLLLFGSIFLSFQPGWEAFLF